MSVKINHIPLRSIIKIPNGVIRLFHIPDEPSDIIREIGILMGLDYKVSLYSRLNEPSRAVPEQLASTISGLEAQHPRHDFSLKKDWKNISEKNNDPVFSAQIKTLQRQVENNQETGWEDVYSLLTENNCDIYDILTIASYVLKQDVGYEFHLIDRDTLRGWDATYFKQM